MNVRRGPAVVLSLVLGVAALTVAPGAVASDGGAAKVDDPARDIGAGVSAGFTFDGEKDTDPCEKGAKVRLKVDTDVDGRLVAAGIVWSDDDDVWDWKFRHNDELSDKGDMKAKDADKSFKIIRTMINFNGPDFVVFRAENTVTNEVCRAELWY